MADEKIKTMLKDIIDNGAEYECRSILEYQDIAEWKPYKLGEGINSNYEYRKVEKWYVVKETNQTFTICLYEKAKQYNPIYFEGLKEQCEKWIEEHTKKTWLETYKEKCFLGSYFSLPERGTLLSGIEEGANEVCKKILEEVGSERCITSEQLHLIIERLGVEL